MATSPWNERYASGDLPWDTGTPDPVLVEMIGSGRFASGRALEVGTGTGTNALWLAGQGYEVIGVDVSPLAVAAARSKLAAAPGSCRFEVVDFLAGVPAGGPFELVFDRGCFHVFDEPEARARYAAHVAEALAPAGRWLSLIGSTEGPPRDTGPPRRSARDVVLAIEPVLEIEELRAMTFESKVGPACGWVSVARRRAVPAQPSTRRA